MYNTGEQLKLLVSVYPSICEFLYDKDQAVGSAGVSEDVGRYDG